MTTARAGSWVLARTHGDIGDILALCAGRVALEVSQYIYIYI